MRSGVVSRLGAVAIGVAFASAAMLVVSYWSQSLIDQRGQEEVRAQARRTITLADARIVSALSTLDALDMRGIETCGAHQLDALQQAAFSNPWIKDMTVVGADGAILCGSSGTEITRRKVLSIYRPQHGRDLSIAVIRIGAQDTMVGVTRRADGTAGLMALIPAALFATRARRDGGDFDSHLRLTAADGTLIVQRGAWDTMPFRQDFIATGQSARYGVKATIGLPRAALQAEASRMNEIVMTIAAAMLALIVGLVLLLPRRRGGDPVSQLEQAIVANEFVPYYQPVVDIRTGRLRGAEVLIRWRKPDGSIIMPAAFIPMAESSGLIVPLTRALMRRVCEEVGPAVGLRPDLKIGFNLAAMHFVDDNIVNDVREIFSGSRLSLRQVVLEVTERQPLHSLAGARRVIASLQDLGCAVSIDDVGTGHGGLSYILKLGADTIKIDKLFIDAIGSEHQSTIILETLVDLARNMRMEVVAEGVENFEQVVRLRELGILAAQGHVFCPPLPGPQFLQLVEAIAKLPPNLSNRGQTDTMSSAPIPISVAA